MNNEQSIRANSHNKENVSETEEDVKLKELKRRFEIMNNNYIKNQKKMQSNL